MSETPIGDVTAQTRLQPVTVPGQTRRARAALPAPVLTKLEKLETTADAARALARVTSERVRTARDEQQALARRIEEVRTYPVSQTGAWVRSPDDGPTARVWRPAADCDLVVLERDFVTLTADLTRRMAEAEIAQDRATAAGQVAERARRYLGI